MGMENSLAVILAGGRGVRMGILCEERPKPLLAFAGKFRIIDFVLSNCIHSQISDIFVLTDYHRSLMQSYLSEWGRKNYDINVLEPRFKPYAGTADAVFQNLDRLEKYPGEEIIVLAADHVYRMDYRDMLAHHRRSGADATVGVVTIPFANSRHFGMVNTNSDDRIIDFVEKPLVSQSKLASMGIYVFNRKTLLKRLVEDAAQGFSFHDFGRSILPRMVTIDKVFAFRFSGYWADVGIPAAYHQANLEMTRETPLLSLEGYFPILTGGNSGRLPKVSPEARILNSLISSDCIVRGNVENSVLSPGVRIETYAIVKNSVVLSNSYIGHYAVIDQCIIDENVKVGDYCCIGAGKQTLTGEDDIAIIGQSGGSAHPRRDKLRL
jgi:glucose-1-phosphate adenylyltransferase